MPVKREPKSLPFIFVNKTEVSKRVNNYKTQKQGMLTEKMNGKEETRSIWYSREHLEEIMRELYYLNADGVRLYFAAYDPEHELYGSQLSLVFVPTYLTEENKHRDIIIEDEENYTARKAMKQTGFDANKGLDFGALCKPDCGDHELLYPLP
jgi:hypothetical protein